MGLSMLCLFFLSGVLNWYDWGVIIRVGVISVHDWSHDSCGGVQPAWPGIIVLSRVLNMHDQSHCSYVDTQAA